MMTFVDRVAFLRQAVLDVRDAAAPVAHQVYRREAALEVLTGKEQPREVLIPLSVACGASFGVVLRPTGAGSVTVGVRIDLGLRDHGTIPTPDPYHVLAGMLATEELQQEAREAYERALVQLRELKDEEPCDPCSDDA